MSPIIIDETATSLVNKERDNEAADFETAVTAAEIGKFNYFLILVSFVAVLSGSFATTTMSYVIPVAECDLALTLVDKGLLNGSIYIGTICSVFIWGFLADAYGRRKLQIWGQLLDTICSIGCAFSVSFEMLFIFKFLNGLIGSGPFTILMVYIAEFQQVKMRSKIVILTGLFLASGNVLIGFIAWWILPMDINFHIIGIDIKSWRVFLLISSLPSLIATFGHYILPESPKYLMTSSQNHKALEVFRTMYRWNTGSSKKLYPIKYLVNEKALEPYGKLLNDDPIKKKNGMLQSFQNGLKETKRMFFPPYLKNLIIVVILQTGIYLGYNTLRIWLPQLLTTIDNYSQANNSTNDIGMCDIFEHSVHQNNITINLASLEQCTLTDIDNIVYIQSIIVSVCSCVGYIFVGPSINFFGSRKLLILTLFVTSLSGIFIYWSTHSILTLVLSSVYVTLGGICAQIGIALVVELFPTSLRAMVMSISMITGRLGSISGSVLFPALMEIGCLPPFILLCGVLFFCALVAYLLPTKSPEFK